jgi:hypothetical protein
MPIIDRKLKFYTSIKKWQKVTGNINNSSCKTSAKVIADLLKSGFFNI